MLFLQAGLAEAQQSATSAAAAEFIAAEPAFGQAQSRTCRVSYASPKSVLSPMAGVLEMQVADQALVQQGDVLAVFDTRDLVRQQARLGWRKQLLQSQIDRHEQDIGPLQASLHQSRIAQLDGDISEANETLERLRELAASNRVSEADLRAADKRSQSLIRARSEAETQFTIRSIEDDLRIEQWRYEIRSIDLDIEDLLETLARSEIRAPTDGLVTGIEKALAANGKGLVREGIAILEIADPTALSAAVKVTEEDMLTMREASVSVISSADPSQIAQAQVARTTPLANEVFSNTDYEIEIAFDAGQIGQWDIDSKATCRFEQPSAAQGGALVPLRAVQYDGDTPVLTVVDASGAVGRRAVRLGGQSRGMIHVVEGIEVGDRVRY